MAEKFITLTDFCESKRGEYPIAGEAKERLGELGHIACITETMANDAEIADLGANAEFLATNLAISRVRTSCSQCLNGGCDFRREENTDLPEARQDEYYQPSDKVKKFL